MSEFYIHLVTGRIGVGDGTRLLSSPPQMRVDWYDGHSSTVPASAMKPISDKLYQTIFDLHYEVSNNGDSEKLHLMIDKMAIDLARYERIMALFE